jgi:hypothetical protein
MRHRKISKEASEHTKKSSFGGKAHFDALKQRSQEQMPLCCCLAFLTLIFLDIEFNPSRQKQ